MMFELFLESAWKVLLAGLVLGAGLPAVFGLGVRFTAAGAGAAGAEKASGSARTSTTAAGTRPAYTALGVVLFAVVAIAVVLGITEVVAAGFGRTVSFEHVLPTIVAKG